MAASDLWVETHQGLVRADQIVHVETNKPTMSVNTATALGNIEKLSDDRWFTETHWYGIYSGDEEERRTVAIALVQEIALRSRNDVPGLIKVQQDSGAVSFEPFA
ncbi:hypothetical protein ABZX92_44970 [Lentzea sp. NPDC006480]|uniref:hypothetical protein n=1 Tax=Lentzea sp. NPDC006480 TaxID=3157176 RepID=UPI0033A890D0